MARLNITVPDMLYARLEQLRDRINLSKVCATALEKEVAMLEGQPNITDPRIARLVQRLQSTRERWYQRGSDDGMQWAVELATRQELQGVATHLADHDGQQLASIFRQHAHQQDFIKPGQPPQPPMMHTVAIHQQDKGWHAAGSPPPMPPGAMPTMLFHKHPGMPFPGFPVSFQVAERLQYWEDQDRQMSGQPGEAIRIEVDEAAYLEGWRDAVKGLWQTIAPTLS